MQKLRSAFTFVELIVVLTIVAILATIWFTVYESYLSSGRDTNRVVQLKDIHGWLTVYSTKSRLPLPDAMVTVESGWSVLTYQWNISDTIIKAIKYNGGWKDTELDIFPTYTLAANQKDFQLLWFVEDAETLLIQNPIQKVRADVDYTVLFPKLIWAPLGTMLDSSTQEPLQESEIVTGTSYDILTWTWDLRVYYSDREFFDTSWWDILDIIPNRTCNRIMWLWNARWNGEYTILPDGLNPVRVYCNMEIDGGGWTLIARSVPWAAVGDFGWNYATWSIADDSLPFSYGSWSRFLNFNQILNTQYSVGKKVSKAVAYSVDWQYFFDNFDQQFTTPTDDWYASNINECRSILNVGDNHCGDNYAYKQLYWWKFGLNSNYYFSYSNNNEYGLTSALWEYRSSSPIDEFHNTAWMLFVK